MERPGQKLKHPQSVSVSFLTWHVLVPEDSGDKLSTAVRTRWPYHLSFAFCLWNVGPRRVAPSAPPSHLETEQVEMNRVDGWRNGGRRQ